MNGPYFVEILSGGREVRHRYRVEDLPIRIGRAYDNDVILDDPHCSAHHATIDVDGAGELRVCDGGSRNGIRHRRRAVTELNIDGRTIFQLGHTRLRVRRADFPVEEALTDSLLKAWDGWLPALTGALLIVAVSACSIWIETTDKFEIVSFSMALIGLFSLGLVWCAIWAFASRLFAGHARLGRHLFILGCGFVAFELWNRASGVAAYALSLESLTGFGSHGSIAILCAMLWFHLDTIWRGRWRTTALVCLLLTLLCSGVKLMLNERENGSLADDLIMREQLPPVVRISSDRPVTRLFEEAAKLKSRVDRQRSQPGDETDNDEQE